MFDREPLDDRVGDGSGERLDELELLAVRDLLHAGRDLAVVDRVLEPVGEGGLGDLERDVVEERARRGAPLEDAVAPEDPRPSSSTITTRPRPRSAPRPSRERRERAGSSLLCHRPRQPRGSPTTGRSSPRGRRGSDRASACEMPTTTGRPSATISSSRRRSSKLLDGLAEPEAGVEADAILGDAGVDGELQPLLEKCHDLGHDVVIPRADLHRPRLAEHVHQAYVGAGLGDHGGALVAPQGGHVVDELGAEGQCPAGHLRLRRVDRDGTSPCSASSTGTTRCSSSSRETGAAPGRVDSLRCRRSPPLRRASAGGSDSVVGRQVGAAVRERVRGDVDDPITDGRGKRCSIAGRLISERLRQEQGPTRPPGRPCLNAIVRTGEIQVRFFDEN